MTVYRFRIRYYHLEHAGVLVFERECVSEQEALLCGWLWVLEHLAEGRRCESFGGWRIGTISRSRVGGAL